MLAGSFKHRKCTCLQKYNVYVLFETFCDTIKPCLRTINIKNRHMHILKLRILTFILIIFGAVKGSKI